MLDKPTLTAWVGAHPDIAAECLYRLAVELGVADMLSGDRRAEAMATAQDTMDTTLALCGSDEITEMLAAPYAHGYKQAVLEGE